MLYARYQENETSCPMTQTFTSRMFCLTIALLCAQTAGCSSLRDRTNALKDSTRNLLAIHKKDAKKKPAERADRMVAIWTETTMHGPGQKPTRGVGGRIFLYNSHHQAVEADGELVVYAYHDVQGEDEKVQPDRKYVITSDEFQKHYSPSDLGPSYSVWIPWDAVGNPTTSISLVPVFRSGDGQAVVGDHSRNLLPGKPAAPSELVRRKGDANDASIQPAAFESQNDMADGESEPVGYVRRGVKTSSIAVPATMRQRLMQAMEKADRERVDRTPRRSSDRTTELSAAPRETTALASSPVGSSTDPTGTTPRQTTNRLLVRRQPFQPRVPAWQFGSPKPDPQGSQPGQPTWPYRPAELPEDSQSGTHGPSSRPSKGPLELDWSPPADGGIQP
jgi:hypothetical protein